MLRIQHHGSNHTRTWLGNTLTLSHILSESCRVENEDVSTCEHKNKKYSLVVLSATQRSESALNDVQLVTVPSQSAR